MIDPIGADNRKPGASWARYQSLYNQTAAAGDKGALYQANPDTGLSAPQRVHQGDNKGPAGGIKDVLEGKKECQTCANRKYMDRSNDPGVSMKSPTGVSPGNAASAVMSHEQQHVSRNAFSAEQQGREVISSNVQIHSAICPECGRSYVSGGTTTTVTGARQEAPQANADGSGRFIDKKV